LIIKYIGFIGYGAQAHYLDGKQVSFLNNEVGDLNLALACGIIYILQVGRKLLLGFAGKKENRDNNKG
jgi:hypothetical protein